MLISSMDNCTHFSFSKFIDYNIFQYFSFHNIFNEDENESEEYNPNIKLINFIFYNNSITFDENKKSEENSYFESLFHKNNIIYNDDLITNEEHIYFLCLPCGEILRTREDINNYAQKENHYIAINLTDISI